MHSFLATSAMQLVLVVGHNLRHTLQIQMNGYFTMLLSLKGCFTHTTYDAMTWDHFPGLVVNQIVG